jgi:hypothetical protein
MNSAPAERLRHFGLRSPSFGRLQTASTNPVFQGAVHITTCTNQKRKSRHA